MTSPAPSDGSEAHFVYLLRCAGGTLYTGYTTDVARRVDEHNRGSAARYTRSRRPVTLIASWEFTSRSEALRTEYAIKRLSHGQKLDLASRGHPAPSPTRGDPDYEGRQ